MNMCLSTLQYNKIVFNKLSASEVFLMLDKNIYDENKEYPNIFLKSKPNTSR